MGKLFDYSNFSEFWSDLNSGGELNRFLDDGMFMFRGESSDKWELKPKAFRENAFEKFNIYKVLYWNLNDNDDTLKVLKPMNDELCLLKNFYQLSNQVGLKIPQVEDFSKINFFTMGSMGAEQLNKNGLFEIYNREIEELATFAQHYGIPTCMLDWSLSFLVALYFAYSSVEDEIGNIRIWIFNIAEFNLRNISNKIPLKLVYPMYSNNENCKNQYGLLSYCNIKDKYENLKNYACYYTEGLDYIINKNFPVAENKNRKEILAQIIIPKSEKREVLKKLDLFGISKCTLFRNFESIIDTLQKKPTINIR